jgi:acyl carrier protein
MEIQERVREIVAEKLGKVTQELAFDLNLHTLDWDSLDLLELVVDLEEEFDISVNDERFSKCETITELAELISANLQE